jgi:hypothetical protein
VAAAVRQGGVNASHAGDPALDTGDFGDVSRGYPAAGNLRVDYVLPSVDLEVLDAMVKEDRFITLHSRLLRAFVAAAQQCEPDV